MKKRNNIPLIMLFAYILIITSSAYAGSIAVIVNKNNTESIDIRKLRKIFTKEYRIWSNGKDVVPVDLKNESDIYFRFSKKVAGKTPRQLKSYWIQQRITKNIKEPLSFKNAAKVKSFVQKVGNAIAYIPKDSVDNSVKIVLELD